MISSIITAHGYKPHKLLPSYESSLASGASETIITLTGVTPKDLRTIKRKCPKARLVTNSSNYSNGQWINGISAAAFPFVHLLHDGDTLVPNILHNYSPSTDITIFQAVNLQGYPFLHKELCFPGVNIFDVHRLLTKPNTKTISPGKAIWRKEVLLNALHHFETISSPSLLVGDSLVIGNDLYCWLHGNPSFSADQRVLLGYDSLDSTTVRGDRSVYHRLERLYDRVRKQISFSWQPELLVTLYDRGVSSELLKNFKNLSARKFLYDKLTLPEQSSKDISATISWLTALEYAHFMGYSHFMYFEGDCYINPKHRYQYQSIPSTEDYLAGKRILQCGTPHIWGPTNYGKEFYANYLRNALTSRIILCGPNAPARTSYYCNGALATYDTEFHYEIMYGAGMSNPASISPFDLVSGYHLVDIFREDVFTKVANNPHIYSDCGDFNIPQALRKEYKKTCFAIHKDTTN